MTTIVGLDFSLTACAVAITSPGRTIELHKFSSDPAVRLRGRLKRYRYLAGCVVDVVRPHVERSGARVLLAIESHPVHISPGQFRGVLDRAGCREILIDRLDPLVDCWVEINVVHLKQYATGMGNANKQDVIAKCNERWGQSFGKRDDNEADAYVLARMGCELASYRADGVELDDCVAKVIAHSAPPKPPKPKKTKAKRAKQELLAVGGAK